VLGLDVSQARVDALSRSTVPFHEPGLESLLQHCLSAGRLAFTTDYALAAAHGDVHFICVGTPQAKDTYRADLTALEACVAALAPLLTRRCLVVGKCTVPAGTASNVAERLPERLS
jgi:UDPglucose 6-dehydrogenase